MTEAGPTLGFGLVLMAILALQVASRAYLMIRFRWAGNDALYFLTVARRNCQAQPAESPFLVPGDAPYPPLLPALLARMPTASHRLLQAVGPLAEGLTAAVTAIFAWVYWGPTAAVAAAVVVLTTPYSFDISFALSPRPIANLFLSVGLLAVAWAGPDWMLGAGVAGLTSALVLLTHRLTAQSTVACILAYGLYQPAGMVLWAGTAVALALLLSRGQYARVLAGHVAFVIELVAFMRRRSSSIGSVLRIMLGNVRRLVRGNPHIVLVAAVVALGAEKPSGLLVLWCGAVLGLSVGWVLGEGDRHFANATVPVALIVAWAVSLSPAAAGAAAATSALGAIFIVAKLVVYPKLAETGVPTIVTQGLRDVCETARASWSGTNRPLVFTWPQSIAYQTMYFADADVVLGDGGTGRGFVYNRELEARVRARGLSSLTTAEQPDLLVCVENQGLVIPASWHPIASSEGFTAYSRGALSPRRL